MASTLLVLDCSSARGARGRAIDEQVDELVRIYVGAHVLAGHYRRKQCLGEQPSVVRPQLARGHSGVEIVHQPALSLGHELAHRRADVPVGAAGAKKRRPAGGSQPAPEGNRASSLAVPPWPDDRSPRRADGGAWRESSAPQAASPAAFPCRRSSGRAGPGHAGSLGNVLSRLPGKSPWRRRPPAPHPTAAPDAIRPAHADSRRLTSLIEHLLNESNAMRLIPRFLEEDCDLRFYWRRRSGMSRRPRTRDNRKAARGTRSLKIKSR